LWPKGDGWGGGGTFSAGNDIQLNHRSNEMALADGFSLPKWLHVGQFGDRPGWGRTTQSGQNVSSGMDGPWSRNLER
jgi:hypothetical protein